MGKRGGRCFWAFPLDRLTIDFFACCICLSTNFAKISGSKFGLGTKLRIFFDCVLLSVLFCIRHVFGFLARTWPHPLPSSRTWIGICEPRGHWACAVEEDSHRDPLYVSSPRGFLLSDWPSHVTCDTLHPHSNELGLTGQSQSEKRRLRCRRGRFPAFFLKRYLCSGNAGEDAALLRGGSLAGCRMCDGVTHSYWLKFEHFTRVIQILGN